MSDDIKGMFVRLPLSDEQTKDVIYDLAAQIVKKDAEIARLREALTVKSDLHIDAALSAFHHMRGYSGLEKVRSAVISYCKSLKGGAA